MSAARTSPTHTWTVSYGSPCPARSCSTRRLPGTPPDSWFRSADQARSALGKASDARGRRFGIVDLPQPDLDRITGEGDDFVSTYANFSIANDAVFMSRSGDTKVDRRAKGILQEYFPKRDTVPVRIDTIASDGGHPLLHPRPARQARRLARGRPVFRPAPAPALTVSAERLTALLEGRGARRLGGALASPHARELPREALPVGISHLQTR